MTLVIRAFRATHRNKKTGYFYEVLNRATDATNSRDGTSVLVYRSARGDWYVRDSAEFADKFQPL